MAGEVCGVELVEDRLVEALLVYCRAQRIEPPGRVERIIASAQARFDTRFCDTTVQRLGPAASTRLEGLIAAQDGDDGPGPRLPAHRHVPGDPRSSRDRRHTPGLRLHLAATGCPPRR